MEGEGTTTDKIMKMMTVLTLTVSIVISALTFQKMNRWIIKLTTVKINITMKRNKTKTQE